MDKVVHDMKQFAFTKRKLEATIKMGNFLEKAYGVRKKGIFIWYLYGPFRTLYLLNKLLKELETMSEDVTNRK